MAVEQEQLELNKIPKTVMESLMAKFPKAEIQKWSKEKEGNAVIYDIEFKQRYRKYEADIKADGTIENWERAINVKELPIAVRRTIRNEYPNSKIKEVMKITAVKNGKDSPEGYEIVLEIVEKRTIEVMAAPDGIILEEAGD